MLRILLQSIRILLQPRPFLFASRAMLTLLRDGATVVPSLLLSAATAGREAPRLLQAEKHRGTEPAPQRPAKKEAVPWPNAASLFVLPAAALPPAGAPSPKPSVATSSPGSCFGSFSAVVACAPTSAPSAGEPAAGVPSSLSS